MNDSPRDDELDRFRSEVVTFLRSSQASGIACRAFGAILATELHAEALAWQRHMAESGFAGIHWPVEYRGRGLIRAHTAVWFEECARAQVAPYLNLQGIVLAGEAILRSGTPEQKARFLPPTLTGEILWVQLFSEPEAGSDLASLQARAERDGDRYVVNGQKVWSSNGQFAQFGILMARTDPHLPRHKGISFFLLDMSLPGIDVRPLKQMTGDAEFCEVFFDDVAMPADALLGPENEGWRVAMEVLGDERGSVGAAGVIGLGHRLDGLGSLSPAGPVARDALADLVTDGRALMALLERSGQNPAAASVGKLARSEFEARAAGLAATFRGADAMLADAETDRFLYAPGMKIAGGSSEIQRNIIGERMLGLPRDL